MQVPPAITRLLALALAICGLLAGASGASAAAFIRLDQVGFLPNNPKTAVLLSSTQEQGVFSVVDQGGTAVFTAAIPSVPTGSWSPGYPYCYLLDFTALATPGNYHLAVSAGDSAVSPSFQLAADASLYNPILANALFFFKAQRDGPNVDPAVFNRKPWHLADATALAYHLPQYFRNLQIVGKLRGTGTSLDASGGWLDAGDDLKFVQTTSYVVAVMLFTVRQYPEALSPNGDFLAESRFGLDWLLKMWDQQARTLYVQVGTGEGNRSGTFIGDHDLWRDPITDDALSTAPDMPDYFLKYRPVFVSGRARSFISPNLAGRMAAALALGSQLFRATDPAYANRCLLAAETIYRQARTDRITVTASPRDYYPETEWRDDMEWGAAELYLAITSAANLPEGLPLRSASTYLTHSATWAYKYNRQNARLQRDSLNLYDTSALAHYELYRAIGLAGSAQGLMIKPADLLANLDAQLRQGAEQAATDPFGLGIGYDSGEDLVPHALGLAVTAHLFGELTGSDTYRSFARAQMDWVLGRNAWGSSFIVGAGSVFPHHLQHQYANLSGSLDGSGPILLGATVDGPTSPENLDPLDGFPEMRVEPVETDPFTRFNGRGAAYLDNVMASSCVEPTLDYTVIALLAFAQEASRAAGN